MWTKEKSIKLKLKHERSSFFTEQLICRYLFIFWLVFSHVFYYRLQNIKFQGLYMLSNSNLNSKFNKQKKHWKKLIFVQFSLNIFFNQFSNVILFHFSRVFYKLYYHVFHENLPQKKSCSEKLSAVLGGQKALNMKWQNHIFTYKTNFIWVSFPGRIYCLVYAD